MCVVGIAEFTSLKKEVEKKRKDRREKKRKRAV